MKKDTPAAIFVGFILGLFVAFLIINFPTLMKKGIIFNFQLPKFSLNQKNQNISPSATPTVSKLEITSPQPNSISSKDKLTLTGRGKAGSTLIVDSNLEDKVITIGNDGNFKVDITLSEGPNDLLITSYINSQTSDSQNLSVSYTPEKL